MEKGKSGLGRQSTPGERTRAKHDVLGHELHWLDRQVEGSTGSAAAKTRDASRCVYRQGTSTLTPRLPRVSTGMSASSRLDSGPPQSQSQDRCFGFREAVPQIPRVIRRLQTRLPCWIRKEEKDPHYGVLRLAVAIDFLLASL
jgi:hypothetical protein